MSRVAPLKARAFTLIEVLICLGILAILLFPLLEMVEGVNSAYDKSIRLANLRSDLDRVGARVIGLLRGRPSYIIGADNRSVALGQGQQLRWTGDSLLLEENGRTMTVAKQVTNFALFRRDGLTTLCLQLRDPAVQKADQKRFLVEEGGYAARL